MLPLKERFIVNADGAQVGVVLDIKTYRRLLKEMEELESIRAYDAAKAYPDEAIPFERAVREIEKTRK